MSEKTAKKEKTEEKKEKAEKKVDTSAFEVKIKELEDNLAACKDQMLRHQADLENYKKRLIREKEEAVTFANTKLIEELLVFMDNLERASGAAKTSGDVKALTDGIEMIQSQLLTALNKNWGLEKIASENVEFNPSEHEACMAVVDDSLKTETIMQILQPGYKLHDRVIRPAKVKIGKPE